MSQITLPIATVKAKTPWGCRLYSWGLLLILLDVLVGASILGVQLRHWAWDYTEMARFRFDVERNYNFGQKAINEGFLNVYENQVITNPPSATKIDYAPLRLALFSGWARWNNRTLENPQQWQESYEFNAFLMKYNTSIEWLAAIAAFLLVHHWVHRSGPPLPDATRLQKLLRGSFRSTLAFLLLWFNPAMIASAHGWPSSDMWVVPFFLWAVLLACWEWWFLAGLVMGLGAMFKGQQLFTVSLFVLWPIFAGQVGRALRWLSGFGFMAALVISGWMLTYPTDANVDTPDRIFDYAALTWVITATLAVLIVNGWRFVPRKWRWGWIPVALFGLWLIVRPGLHDWSAWSYLLLAMAGAVTIVAVWLPLRHQGYMTAGIAAMTLLLCIVFYHGTTAWWELGFMYGTERHPQMVVGPGNNLGALLSERFGWRDPKEIVTTISLPASIAGGSSTPPAPTRSSPMASAAGTPGWVDVDIQIRHLLISIYAVLLVISCIAIARQWRRNDRRFLVAIIVPWLLFYTIPAQIHERYLLFGSTAAAIVVGCSFGLAALNIFLVLLTVMQTCYSMMGASWLTRSMDHPLLNADFSNFYSKLRPDISWAVLVVTAVFFFAAFSRSRWSYRATTPSAELKGVD